MPNRSTFCVCPIEYVDRFATEAEAITAYDAKGAAIRYAESFADLDDDSDECEVIVATDKNGADAVKFTVTVQVIREYDVMSGPEKFTLPGASNEDAEPVPPVDTLTLPLFGE